MATALQPVTRVLAATRRKNAANRRTVRSELKQEVGLGHYEGRGWRGFHHHATLCIAAYGFLISERETIPPLRTAFRCAAPATYRIRQLPTPRILPCGLNGTSQTRSLPCAEGSSQL